jgi:hypothetical protein
MTENAKNSAAQNENLTADKGGEDLPVTQNRVDIGVNSQNENLTKRLQSLRERITTSNSDYSPDTIGGQRIDTQGVLIYLSDILYRAINDPQIISPAQTVMSAAVGHPDTKIEDLQSQLAQVLFS